MLQAIIAPFTSYLMDVEALTNEGKTCYTRVSTRDHYRILKPRACQARGSKSHRRLAMLINRIIQEQSAFTLAELMVALLALIMIVGLALPALSGMLQ